MFVGGWLFFDNQHCFPHGKAATTEIAATSLIIIFQPLKLEIARLIIEKEANQCFDLQ